MLLLSSARKPAASVRATATLCSGTQRGAGRRGEQSDLEAVLGTFAPWEMPRFPHQKGTGGAEKG